MANQFSALTLSWRNGGRVSSLPRVASVHQGATKSDLFFHNRKGLWLLVEDSVVGILSCAAQISPIIPSKDIPWIPDGFHLLILLRVIAFTASFYWPLYNMQYKFTGWCSYAQTCRVPFTCQVIDMADLYHSVTKPQKEMWGHVGTKVQWAYVHYKWHEVVFVAKCTHILFVSLNCFMSIRCGWPEWRGDEQVTYTRLLWCGNMMSQKHVRVEFWRNVCLKYGKTNQSGAVCCGPVVLVHGPRISLKNTDLCWK